MKKELASIVASALTVGIASTSVAAPKWAKKGQTIVKCQGIAKKGKNDCVANGHSCANQAKKTMTLRNGSMYLKAFVKK